METIEAPLTHVPEHENMNNNEVKLNNSRGRTLPAIDELN